MPPEEPAVGAGGAAEVRAAGEAGGFVVLPELAGALEGVAAAVELRTVMFPSGLSWTTMVLAGLTLRVAEEVGLAVVVALLSLAFTVVDADFVGAAVVEEEFPVPVVI